MNVVRQGKRRVEILQEMGMVDVETFLLKLSCGTFATDPCLFVDEQIWRNAIVVVRLEQFSLLANKSPQHLGGTFAVRLSKSFELFDVLPDRLLDRELLFLRQLYSQVLLLDGKLDHF